MHCSSVDNISTVEAVVSLVTWRGSVDRSIEFAEIHDGPTVPGSSLGKDLEMEELWRGALIN